VEEIFKNEEFEEDEDRKFSNEIYENIFVRIGRFSIDQRDHNSACVVIDNIEKTGIKACEEGFKWAAIRAAISLSTIGNMSIRERLEGLAKQAVLRLYGIGDAAIRNELQNAIFIIKSLVVVKNYAHKNGFEDIGSAEMWLEELRKIAKEKENRNLVKFLDKLKT